MLTKERCDECIGILDGKIYFEGSTAIARTRKKLYPMLTPDEAELFANCLLDAVKRARKEPTNG